MANIRKIFDEGKLDNGKSVGKLSPSAFPGHEEFNGGGSKNPNLSLHNSYSTTGEDINKIASSMKGSAARDKILPKNIKKAPQSPAFSKEFAQGLPDSGGKWSNLDMQTLGTTYRQFLDGLIKK